MTLIENSTLIDCTPQQAFDYLADICNQLEWNPAAQAMEKITPGPMPRSLISVMPRVG